MKTITAPNTTVAQILGKQAFDGGESYRPFKYIFVLSRGGTHIAYHMLTRELIELTAEEHALLCRSECFPKSREGTLSAEKELVEKRFLVPRAHDDMKLVSQVTAFLSAVSRTRGFTSFDILPTTDCNARCFYCYEHGTRKLFTDDKTARDIADFIEKSSKGQKITIRWFGGEPLYNARAIDIISDSLAEKGISFSSSMVTNGYLFDEELIKRAKEGWHLNLVQITLDGTEQVYNRVKNYIYKDGESPYKRVISNIERLLKSEITVTIRLNIDKHNADNLYELVKELSPMLALYKNCSVYTALLYEKSGTMTIKRTEEGYEALKQAMQKITAHLVSSGVNTARGKLPCLPPVNHCMADSDSSVLILPDGRLSKCEHALERDIIGTIYSDTLDGDIIKEWKKPRPMNERCADCPVLPDCRVPAKCESSPYCHSFDQQSRIRSYEDMIWRKMKREVKGNS